MKRNQAQRERTDLCRLSGVFWNDRRWFVQLTWCREHCGCWRWINYGKERHWRCGREEGIHILEFLPFDSYPAFSCIQNTKWPSLHLAQPRGTSWMRSLETRFWTRGEDSLRRGVLLWHLIQHFLLRPRASQSKLSSSQVVLTLQPSNTASNTKRWKAHMQLMSFDKEYVIVRFVMLLALPKGDFRREADDIHNQWFWVLCQHGVQYYDTRAKMA